MIVQASKSKQKDSVTFTDLRDFFKKIWRIQKWGIDLENTHASTNSELNSVSMESGSWKMKITKEKKEMIKLIEWFRESFCMCASD